MKRRPPIKEKSSAKANPARESLIPLQQVRALIDLLEERGLEEFELEHAGLRIRIKRRGAASTPPPVFENYLSPTANAAPAPVVETRSGEAQVETASEMGLRGEDVHIVKSPIVGTFYATPRPDAPPFVNLGDVVQVGEVLCIVEAMKLMNEIEADVAGEIIRIYLENAQPVEYGEPLFAIQSLKKK